MFEILLHGGSLGIGHVTARQVAAPSRVRCTSPSFAPAHTTPACRGDSAIANKVAPSKVMRLSVVTPPEPCSCVVSLRVRSGLITLQREPPSVVTCTTWLPTYTRLWSCGEIAMG